MKNIELFIAILSVLLIGTIVLTIKTSLFHHIVTMSALVVILACIIFHLVNRK